MLNFERFLVGIGLALSAMIRLCAQEPHVSPPIILQKIDEQCINARRAYWHDYFNRCNQRKIATYVGGGAVVAMGIAYAVWSSMQQPTQQGNERVAASPQLKDVEALEALFAEQQQQRQHTMQNWFQQYAKEFLFLIIFSVFFEPLNCRLKSLATQAWHKLFGDTFDEFVRNAYTLLHNGKRLQESLARCSGYLCDPGVGDISEKIRFYFTQDVIIDTYSFVKTFEDMIGYVYAALEPLQGKRNVADSLKNLCMVINDFILQEQRVLDCKEVHQDHVASMMRALDDIGGACKRLINVIGSSLYGDRFALSSM
jgi:hypothetical protein